MDQMLPSPFSMSSIGTPIHQPEEDQLIVSNSPYYSQQVGPPNGMSNSGSTPNSSSMGGMQMNSGMGGMGPMVVPSLPSAPTKLNSYQPSYAASPQMQQPQTPVCLDAHSVCN